MTSTVGTAELNNTTFAYETAGAGRPLVFIHAGIADSRMWDRQFSDLADSFTVVRYDMRGFGRTPRVARGVLDGQQDRPRFRALLSGAG